MLACPGLISQASPPTITPQELRVRNTDQEEFSAAASGEKLAGNRPHWRARHHAASQAPFRVRKIISELWLGSRHDYFTAEVLRSFGAVAGNDPGA